MAEKIHLLSALVENKPGVMQRISGMFSRRGFNIENISVGPTDNPAYSRITLAVKGDKSILEQVVKQMNKLIPVIKVRELKEGDAVVRELALVKISTPSGSARSEVAQYVDVFRGNIVDVATDSVIAEIVGDPEKIDAFITVLSPYGIKEVARTGITAMHRGSKNIKSSVK